MNPFKRVQYNAPVTITFVLLALAALVADHFTKGAANPILFMVYRAPPTQLLTYFRLFGHVLGHGGPEHYVNNMLTILIIGPMLEEKYGGKRLALMMAVTALVTGILFIVVSDKALLGASGIVFMLIMLSPFVNMQKGRVPITLILVIAVFLGREIYAGVTSESNVSHMTHIIGGLCGGVFGIFINKSKLSKSDGK
ncbi:MAG: rhomboid family intramembrane serine protease [Defluviitaleaceae bacterium]|nr:rhomboid family intramembrane serine protease [Defluviitaleaceae bacterium]